MRHTGLVAAASGLGRHDHVCWAYEPEDELALSEAVVQFLADGLAAGQRVTYAARADEDELYDVVAGLDGCDALLDAGTLVLRSLTGVYDAAEEHDPVGQVATYAELTRAAVRDGYTGLRVAAEATPLVLDPGRRRTFARYEQLVDRYMATEPFSAMCAYDTTALDREAVAELACVHPAARGEGLSPFQVYAVDAGRSAVSGEIDAFGSDLFSRVLSDLPDDVRQLDASGLSFIDHHGLLALERTARELGGLTVTGAPPSLRRLHGLLGLRHLEVAA